MGARRGCYSPIMKAVPLALLLALSLATVARAQLPPPIRLAPPGESPPPAAAVAPGPPVLTLETCRRLAAQQRSAPPAAYPPGVDVYGRPVAPADLPGSGAIVPPITTEIELGRVGANRAATGGFIRGYVTVEPNGTVLLNGQPLPREQQYGLTDICREQHLLP
jgi:hypothetical protein